MSNSRRFYASARHLKAIRWDAREQCFFFADRQLGLTKLGKLIAHAVCKGEKEIRLPFLKYGSIGWRESWSEGFSVDYLMQMLRFVAEHGWFWDAVEDSDDHVFDPTRITPGVFSKQVEELRALAEQMTERAQWHASHEDGDAAMAQEFRDTAARLSAQADRLLRTSVPGHQAA